MKPLEYLQDHPYAGALISGGVGMIGHGLPSLHIHMPVLLMEAAQWIFWIGGGLAGAVTAWGYIERKLFKTKHKDENQTPS
jgi:hypothetical protein